jgi:hypothetical protein
MHARATNYPTSTSVEVKGKPISESSENPGLTPRMAPIPKVRQTAQLLTNPRQPKRLLHRHHRRRRSSHPGSTPRIITTLRARVALTMQPFDPRLLMIRPVEVSHVDREWLYQPGLSHADSKPLITRRLKAKRILKRIHFHHKRRRRGRLSVEPSSSLRSAIIGTRTDLLTSEETPPRNPHGFSPTRGPMTIPRG